MLVAAGGQTGCISGGEERVGNHHLGETGFFKNQKPVHGHRQRYLVQDQGAASEGA